MQNAPNSERLDQYALIREYALISNMHLITRKYGIPTFLPLYESNFQGMEMEEMVKQVNW